jgi:hypothetical protein
MKSQQKTVLKKLFKLAEDDFIGHTFPTFPKISKRQKTQPKHFDYDDWETLMKTVNELSSGAGRSTLSFEQYKNLEVKQNRQNQRNWVDLFDALWVSYYWFLRSQDIHRLRIEWFKENAKEQEFTLINPEPKSDRTVVETYNIKPDGYIFFKRLLERRGKKGWLIMPFTKRESEGGQENKVRDDLNFLLKKAVEKCLPHLDAKEYSFTNVRHTSFRHHLEDDMTLGQYPKINAFAENGLTSAKMLQETYINYISRTRTLRDSKKKMKSSNYSLIKKVEL